MNSQEVTSTRPYLIRALYEWCTDNGFTPYLVVRVNESVQVPREYVTNGEIVLNVSYDATSALKLGNDFIEFKARFGGEPRDIMVPVGRVVAVYARENGQGMAFPLEEEVGSSQGERPAAGAAVSGGAERGQVQLQPVDSAPDEGGGDAPRPQPPAGGGSRPSLRRVK